MASMRSTRSAGARRAGSIAPAAASLGKRRVREITAMQRNVHQCSVPIGIERVRKKQQQNRNVEDDVNRSQEHLANPEREDHVEGEDTEVERDIEQAAELKMLDPSVGLVRRPDITLEQLEKPNGD